MAIAKDYARGEFDFDEDFQVDETKLLTLIDKY